MLVSYFICSVLLILGVQTAKAPTAKLLQGDVQGAHKLSYKGRIFSAFQGIPYAKPPIGSLRFKEPIPFGKWEGLLVANKSFVCSQAVHGKFSGTEDCLYINVYVPKEIIDPHEMLDVVIHIHGGGFLKESAIASALPDYVMDKDIIMVTMNYRLGALGFLSTQDCTVSGNNGLKDQNLAMKWVKNNIKSFGGNPDSITLTGLSAGSVSVHYHYLSPLSVGLFNRGYSISGTALNPRSLDKTPRQKAEKLASSLKCPVDSSENMVECLRQKTDAELAITTLEFRPVIERGTSQPFLSDHPFKLIKERKIFDVPWITSNVDEEAFFLLDGVYKQKAALQVYKNWLQEGSKLLELNATVEQKDLPTTMEKLKLKYFGDKQLTEDEAIDRLNEVMTDRHYFVGSDLVLRTQAIAMKSPIYQYLSQFVPEDDLECGGKQKVPSHCTDSKLLFKYSSNPDKLKPEEEKMMFLLTEFLETYAKTGIPKIGQVTWLPINPSEETLNILIINSPDDIKMTKVDQLICRKFWKSLPILENDKLY